MRLRSSATLSQVGLLEHLQLLLQSASWPPEPVGLSLGPCSPALKDAPATQWVPSLEAGGAVGELRTGCHKNPVYLDGQ